MDVPVDRQWRLHSGDVVGCDWDEMNREYSV